MEFETQPSNPSSPYVYVTAPSSPNQYNRSCSAPVSPRRNMFNPIFINEENQENSNFDDFEFETSKKFISPLHFSNSQNLDSPAMDDDHETRPKRGDSLPAMAFADELFVNGLVMPLKPPPRLQCESEFNSFSQISPCLSPKSPRTMCRIPFARKNAWNDDFDPFMVALEKVREEKRGRNSLHRRSRSYSPFRGMAKCSSDVGSYNNQENSPVVKPAPSYSGPLEFKGSAYARWVREQTREGRFTSKGPKWFPFGQRVRPVKNEHAMEKKEVRENSGIVKDENKVLKLKAILLRYASFRRENHSEETKVRPEVKKSSYFSRLSFKFKGNGNGSGKKRASSSADTTMAVVEYKPSYALCLGYGIGSPKTLN